MKRKFICDNCGKVLMFNPISSNTNDLIQSNKCWSIDLGLAEYGSKLDGCHVIIDLCDDCLYEIMTNFKYNSCLQF